MRSHDACVSKSRKTKTKILVVELECSGAVGGSHERVKVETSVGGGRRFHNRSVVWDTPMAKWVGEWKDWIQEVENTPSSPLSPSHKEGSDDYCFLKMARQPAKHLVNKTSDVEGLNPAPHIHEQMTTSNYGYDIAYNFTHNNIMLEHNAMNNKNTVAHMDVHNTQY